MASDYEIESPEFLAHGLNVFQSTMLSDSEDEHIERCLQIAGYKRGDKVCDMGCGVGYVTQRMNLAGHETTGVTNSQFQYDYAVKHFPETRFLLCDMTETPLPGNTFDAVQWMESIGYVEHEKAFSEACRILKAGGKAVVKDWGAIKDTSFVWDSWPYRFVSAGEMIKRAEVPGLRLVKAFVLAGDMKRFERFCNDSKLMRELHPIGLKANASIPFWYEFEKL